MANNNTEIEIKFKLNNPKDVINFLSNNSEIISKDVYQKDIYYVPKHRDFLNVKYPYEWLRLRKSEKGDFITYKHFYPENSKITTHCDEYESKVEKVEIMEKVFDSLDFKKIAIVEKIRNTWKYKNTEIMIDNVTGLGYYIEIESTKEFTNPNEGKPYLYSIFEEINASGNEDYRGYPFIIIENGKGKIKQ
jgi:adenylate cyclase class 2